MSDVRNMVLAPYETASVFKKSTDDSFKQEMAIKL
jgi:hypothetical protein